MKAYVFVLLIAATVTYLTTPAVRRFARRIGAITPVRDRDVHTIPIPRLGGTAMMAGFGVAILTASQVPFFDPIFTADRAPYFVLFSAAAVCLLGVADDIWGLDAITKFAGQTLAAGVMAWQGLQLVSLPGVDVIVVVSPAVLILLTVLAVVVTINAVNFVDGLDGLAAGVVGISATAFFGYSYLLSRDTTRDDYSSLASLISVALVGCCAGFLPHNFHPARVFMGDSGSMLIGLLLSTATVAVSANVEPGVVEEAQVVPAFLPLALPLAILALPLIDLVLAVVRRARAGKMFWHPDKMHLHHRMLNLGHSHARAVLILYVWTATLSFGVASVAFVEPLTALAAGVVAVTLAALLTFGPLRGRRRAAARRALEPPAERPKAPVG